MEKCKFTETQFSFCFTFEYIKNYASGKAFPYFPNTVTEGRNGGGYDVKIGGNLYFQFKIPCFYNNQHSPYWNDFTNDYYKIDIRGSKDKGQFCLLKNLEKNLEKKTNRIYYATPEFHKIDSLENHYSNNEIVSHSAIFPLANFPNNLTENHKLVYNDNEKYGILHSESKNIDKVDNVSEIFSNANTAMTVFKNTKKLYDILYELRLVDRYNNKLTEENCSYFILKAFSLFLIRYNIFWLPLVVK